MELSTNGAQTKHQNQNNILNIDEIFMLDGVSYKITMVGEFKFSAIADSKVNVEKNEKINIKNKWYKVLYIHNTKNRITFEGVSNAK